MASFLESLENSSGAASVKSAFDFWNGNIEKQFLPAPPVLSGQYELEFYIGDSTTPIHLFDIDSITKTLITNEKKSFRPFGFTHTIKLINHQGWDIKITGKKTNPALNYLIQKVYQLASYPMSIGPTDQANPKILMPKFHMLETINQYPSEKKNEYRIKEQYVYNDIVITGYDEEVQDDNMPLTFTLSMFAQTRAHSGLTSTKGMGDYGNQDRPNKIDAMLADYVMRNMIGTPDQ